MNETRSEPLTDRSLFDALRVRDPGAEFRSPEEKIRQRCLVRMLSRIVSFGVTKLSRPPRPVSTFDIRDAEATGRFCITVATSYGSVVVQGDPDGDACGCGVEVRLQYPFDALTVDAAMRYASRSSDLAELARDFNQYLTAFRLAAAPYGPLDLALITAQAEVERLGALSALDLRDPA